jgi:hypothetical protein
MHGFKNSQALLADIGIVIQDERQLDTSVYNRLVEWYKNERMIDKIPIESGYYCCPFNHSDGLKYCLKNENKMNQHIREAHQSNFY